MRTPFLLLASLVTLASCNLAVLPREQCGNHVIEDGEDCDGVGIGANTCSATCRLSCAADRVCPPGWGCGTDDVCRQPSGAFRAFGASVALPGDGLALADFDGDGRDDLLGQAGSTFTVAYLGSQGLLPGTATFSITPLDTSPDVPGVGDVDGDGRADLSVRSGSGLGVLRGRADRTFLPRPFLRAAPEGFGLDDDVLIGNFDERPGAPGDELLAVRDDGLYLLRDVDPSLVGTLPLKIASWPAGPRPHVRQGSLQFNARSVVVAQPGASEVVLHALFVYDASGGWMPNFEGALTVPPVSIALPAGGTVTGMPFLGYWRSSNPGNGLYDLLIPGESGGLPTFFVSFNYNGAFHSEPTDPAAEDGAAREFVRVVDGVASTKPILAVGNFNSDIVSDCVTVSAIEISNCVPQCNVQYTPGGPVTSNASTWVKPDDPGGFTGVIVLETNPFVGFSFADVVTLSGASGMTFYKRTPESLFAPFAIPTQAPVERLAFGDVNGDGARDLVFTQLSARATPDAPDVRSLHVSFGDAFGIPTAAVDLGDVGSCDRLFVTNAPAPGEQAIGVDDIYARFADGSGDFYVFEGRTDRAIQSPLDLPLVCSPNGPTGVARVSAIAALDDAPGPDVGILFQEALPNGSFTWQLWSTHADTNVSEELCATLVGPATVDPAGAEDLRLLPLDLDDDGQDELVIVPIGASQLSVARFDGAGWSIDPVPLGEPVLGGATLELRGGQREVVVWSASGVRVLWRGVGGTLEPGEPVSIVGTPCPERSADAVVGAPRGVAAVQLAPKATRDLVVVTNEDTLLVAVDVDAATLSVDRCATDVFEGGGSAVTSGDVDGDGVQDVVIARPGGTRVFAGAPVTP